MNLQVVVDLPVHRGKSLTVKPAPDEWAALMPGQILPLMFKNANPATLSTGLRAKVTAKHRTWNATRRAHDLVAHLVAVEGA